MIEMKNRLKDIKRYLWDVLLFSGIGCFSYFLLVYYADIPSQYQDRLMTFQAFSAVVVLFNGVGLSVKYINEKLMMYYQFFLKNHRMLSIGLITAAIILFISNYLLLVSTKLLIESPHPFMLKDKGLYVMLTVWFIELIIVGQFMLNRFYVDLVKLYKRAEELEEKTAQARYMALQNQLNPHFLLNTLNNIYALIAFDTDKAQQAVQELSKLLRYVLYDNQQTYVPLGKETDFIRNYIELMRIRLSANVQMTTQIDIQPDSQTLIAPLIFISLIENAFKHGISPTERSFIHIHLAENDTEVICEISNSNHPKNITDKSGSGIGLEQVSRRLEILYPGQYTWQKGISEDGKEYKSRLSIRVRDRY